MEDSLDYNSIIQTLFLTLRSVACSYNDKTLSEKTIQKIDQVKASVKNLSEHQVDFTPQLNELSILCNWDLQRFLNEVLEYPKTIPRVRRLDGKLHYEFPIPKEE